MLWDLLRNNGLTNSSFLHIVMQKFNKFQNQIELPLGAKEMEGAWISSSSEDEAKGMDVHLGVEGSNSNGHGEEIDKEGHMMKIIEKLQKDAQTHQTDSRNIRKAQDKQSEFNLKL
jgi:hypothetical protein